VPSLVFRNKPVQVLRCIGAGREGDHYEGVSFIKESTQPDRIVRVENPSYGNWIVAPLWLSNPRDTRDDIRSHWMQCSFPTKWTELCAVKFGNYFRVNYEAVLLNSAHPLVKARSRSAEKWVAKKGAAMTDPLTLKSDLLRAADKAAAWLLYFIGSNPHSAKIWNGLLERDEKFVAELWRVLFGRAGKSVSVHLWTEDSVDSKLLMVSLNGAQVIANGRDVERHLVDPGKEWSLTIEPHRNSGNA
jgi:hypothetical protein